jgi:hypothetical protein
VSEPDVTEPLRNRLQHAGRIGVFPQLRCHMSLAADHRVCQLNGKCEGKGKVIPVTGRGGS